MKVNFYVLGIKRSFRGENLLAALKADGLSAEVIWGIDGRQEVISKDLLDDSKAMFLYGRTLSLAEVACTLGHKLIAEKAKNDDVEFAIILEDDVLIDDLEFVKNCLSRIAQIKDPAMFLLISAPRLNLRLPSLSLRNYKLGVQRIHSNPSPTCAYVLNKMGIDAIVRLPPDVWKGVQADFPPLYFEKLKMYSIKGVKNRIRSPETYSLIGERCQPRLSTARKIHKAANRFLRSFGSRKLNYGLGIRSYFAHFFARSLAWRLNRPIQ